MTDPAAERRDVLAALLGPVGPELTCEDCFEQLDRYVDLELAAADAARMVPGMAPHLSGCPACREDHQSLREFARTDHNPPASFARPPGPDGQAPP